MQNIQQKNAFLDHCYDQLGEDDWNKAIELYQQRCLKHFTINHHLLSAKVYSPAGVYETRLKLHPESKMILWVECTCRKDRIANQLCTHIAALSIHIDRHKQLKLQDLNIAKIKRPALRDLVKKPAPYAQSKTLDEIITTRLSALQSLLTRLKHSITDVKYSNTKKQFEISLGKITRGQNTPYFLDIDSFGTFVSSQDNVPEILSSKKMSIKPGELVIGNYIYESDHETIHTTKVAAIQKQQYSTDSTTIIKDLTETLQVIAQEEQEIPEDCHLIPLGDKNKLCHHQKNYAFLLQEGLYKVDTTNLQEGWYKLPDSQTFKEDHAVHFVEKLLPKYLGLGPVWISKSLKNKTVLLDPGNIEHVNVEEQKDSWFYLDPLYKVGTKKIPLVKLIEQAKNKKRKYYSCGESWIKIPEYIAESKWQVDQTSQKLSTSSLGLMQLRAMSQTTDASLEEQNLNTGTKDLSPSTPTTQLSLRSYQQKGLEWLWWLYQHKLNGLLADDMGLGKTHQAMAFLSLLQQENQEGHARKFLVVCPTSVIDHWFDKIETYAPNLSPIKYHGNERHVSLKNIQTHHVVITTYGILLRDIEILKTKTWYAIVLDEAHIVKNHKTASYRAACSLPSTVRLCLTGTPLENSLSELKNLFDFLVPGYLGSNKFFHKNFMVPISQHQDYKKELLLQNLIHPLKLRRTKKEVLKELPEKIIDKRYCQLSKKQAELYQQILQQQANPLLDEIAQKEKTISFLHILTVLQKLKQVANHPALLLQDEQYENYESGKFNLLKDLLSEAVSSKQKVVVFSQYVHMIRIIESYCFKQNIRCITLTGQSKNRGSIIKDFQTNPEIKVFAASLLAGGTGIDLTAASVVIHYDRWWNATKERQATDRVHRIGQNKSVQVFKLITKGTLEEKIDSLISKKSDIFSRFLDKDQEVFKLLSRSDIIKLLQ